MHRSRHIVEVHCRPVDYLSLRELGRAFQCAHQSAVDARTWSRTLKPYIADTSPDCRSTYLLKLNPTNKLLAAAHGDRSVTIYCAISGRMLAKCVGHERSPWTLAFHPSQPYLLASGCLGGDVRIWNLDCLADGLFSVGQSVLSIQCTKLWKHAGAIASLAFHSVHPILTVAWTQEVVFYDWVAGRKLSVWRFVSNQSRVRWVKFSPDGALLYTATANPPTANTGESTEHNATTETPVGFGVLEETSPSATPSKSANHIYVEDIKHTPAVSRDMLLDFLVSQPDSWFQRLGICNLCALRLCRWAGTLKPEFPSNNLDIQLGACIARQAAQLAGSTMRLAGAPVSRLVQELASLSDNALESGEFVLSDVNPAAVAIIEDMPVREFLLSRGHYCSKPSIVADSGLCCGGHACDLVLTHRELMRHSICRPCLAAFWRWASRFVNWWCWSRDSEVSSAVLDHRSQLKNVEHAESQSIICTNYDHHTDPQLNSHPVGICIQCRARMSDRLKDDSEDKTQCTDQLGPNSHLEDVSTGRQALPLAALELLRSRLSNANEVTPVTYMASDLIAEGNLAQYLRQNLASPTTETHPSSNLSDLIYLSLQHATLAHSKSSTSSPQPKRRKLSEPDIEAPNPSTSYCGAYEEPSAHGVEDLTQGAMELARILRQSDSNFSWNRPRPVRLVKRASPPDGTYPLRLFPYVALGSQLLRPTAGMNSSHQSDENLSTDSPDGLLSSLSGTNEHHLSESSMDVPAKVTCSMTACCRCGRIVPQTFPIDPKSSLSTVVCEKLVLLDDQCGTTSQGSHSLTTIRSSIGSHSNRSYSRRTPRELLSETDASYHPDPSFSPTHRRGNSVMYLINRTNADSMLNAVHRSITEVIAGLFVDMGEHGSATCLQDTTYRICRWELNLCSPVCYGSADFPSRDRWSDGILGQDSILPMPANVAVSYNTNSLVIPHVRLFNDSSICLSPDGRMLAAFVVPGADRSERISLTAPDKPDASSDTLLTIYRLQPKQRRGHCLFAYKFTAVNPVCLDFSPLGDYLAVGMATSRLPSVPFSSSSLQRLSTHQHDELTDVGTPTVPNATASPEPNLIPTRHTTVAHIFRLNHWSERVGCQENSATVVRWTLKEVTSVSHPMLLNPVSCSREFSDAKQAFSDPLDHWHRLLLSSPIGVSLNTLVWNPNGGLFYGTTKGLVVLMGPQPSPLELPKNNEYSTKVSFLSSGDEENSTHKSTSTLVNQPTLASSSGILA